VHGKTPRIVLAASLAVAFGLLCATYVFASGTEKVIFRFYKRIGYGPVGTLIFDASGNLYGVTGEYDTTNSVYELSPGANGTWTGKVLHYFKFGHNDGLTPTGGLIFDAAGNLYGTTWDGGSHGQGVAFEVVHGASGWSEHVLHNFGHRQDGAAPSGGLIFDKAGNLYGVTANGGAYSSGTVFQLSPGANNTWTESVLYSFQDNGVDGRGPEGSLAIDAAGNLYGTTQTGGANGGGGIVFELSPGANGTWTYNVLYNFCSTSKCADGGSPEGGLIFDAAGNLYGATLVGGASQCGNDTCGVVFELTPSGGTWTETVLHSFAGGLKDGFEPNAPLIFDSAGNLYGTTMKGGQYCSYYYDCGVAFELSPSGGAWTETVLHNFSDSRKQEDGARPLGGLIFDSAGNLYGVTSEVWNGSGAAYEITP